ncbi:hypothetical protein R2601_06293 [Salipiger bermudensis HTCC2601]|uniref:Uncharacterized protein n=1 Tax=Salipiger bermudensis (strain DSM 26914 / JCM 13377 / KCTC 12554 / HTCC2601) TaxID=314265 RepID=Q0FK27_SALBH|nr:hypothetical protein R2601_06293 [Salipiger bermudensis HTCC2601]
MFEQLLELGLFLAEILGFFLPNQRIALQVRDLFLVSRNDVRVRGVHDPIQKFSDLGLSLPGELLGIFSTFGTVRLAL